MKKGILLKNTLGIIIAVLGLAVLVLGVYKAINVSVNQETQNAQNTLDGLMAKINAVESGSKVTLQGFSQTGNWYFVAWNKRDATTDDPLPNKCLLFDSCICICKDSVSGVGCDAKGFCKEVKMETEVFSQYFHRSYEAVSDETGGTAGRGVKSVQVAVEWKSSCVSVPKNLFELEIDKSNGDLIVFRQNSNKEELDPFGNLNLCKLTKL